MAIKASNQITFTEQKKILKIKEWYLATDESSGVTVNTTGWTETVQSINDTKKYLWNYEEVIYSIGSSDISDPIIIGFYAQGKDGKSIQNIINYYQITKDTKAPTSWSTTVPMLDPVNRYLWNYEKIVYTTGDPTNTDPAIIGVYGDSGTDAVEFQIYSVDGFEFDDDLKSITLQTIAFQAGEKISSGVTYQWKWWNIESTSSDKYEKIIGATSSSLVVNSSDQHAYASIKCEMTYDGIVYEDYVSLTKSVDVYTATIKFFNGTNIIATGEDYIIAYIELYKNNIAEEVPYSGNVYVSDRNSVSNGTITTDINSGSYKSGDKVYFVCKESAGYNVVLGQYASSKWTVQSNKYIYDNDLFDNNTSPVIFIPKEKIPKALMINCEIKKGNTVNDVVARTSAVVMDLNDPIVSNAAPTNPEKGQLWLDTSSTPSLLKMWDGIRWVDSGYQNGNVVYTSQPNKGYTKGDLWILAQGEKCGDFTQGSMLRANTTSSTFNASHWEDAMSESTAILNNVKQYFMFNADTGLRIGQSNDKFYVNISSTEMGFYDATSGSAQKVVSISNKSATIKDMTVEEGAKFDCEVKFGKFVWKTESDGSLSLALAN